MKSSIPDNLSKIFDKTKKDIKQAVNHLTKREYTEADFELFYAEFLKQKPDFRHTKEVVMTPDNFRKALRYAFIKGYKANG